MRCVTELPRSLSWFRLALVAAITVGTAGCSTDFRRLSDSSSAPNGSRPSSELTGAVQPKPTTGPINSTDTAAAGLAAHALIVEHAGTVLEFDHAGAAFCGPVVDQAGNQQRRAACSEYLADARGDVRRHVAQDSRASIAFRWRILHPPTRSRRMRSLSWATRLAIPASRDAQQPSAAAAAEECSPTPSPTRTRRRATIRKITPTPNVAAENKDLATAATLSFRWPVRGRVIAGFGPKPSGQQNDGINFAVPEGTPIKAAEDGVVAYAGNELKTYGNLVLIRHANGFVTAYAHASEILVKRDEWSNAAR